MAGETKAKREGEGRASGMPLVRAVERAGAVLQTLLAQPRGMRLVELSAATGLHKSTLLRLLRTLMAMGVVRRDEDTDRYRWEPMLWLLISQSAQRHLADASLLDRLLRELAEATGQTAILSIPTTARTHMAQIAYALPRVALQVDVRYQPIVPMERTPAGTVQLAYMPGPELSAYLAARPELAPEGLSGSEEELLAELARVKRQGYAVTYRGAIDGTGAVGVPVQDERGRVVAALDLMGPAERLTEASLRDWLPRMRAAARRLSCFIYSRSAERAAAEADTGGMPRSETPFQKRGDRADDPR
jgi:IclR family pca regulon transcriptional regulator